MAEDWQRKEFLNLPYSDRQHVIFVSDAAFDAKKKEVEQTASLGEADARMSNVQRMLKLYLSIAAPLAVLAYSSLIKALSEAREAGLSILPIPKSWAPVLGLPLGHPRNKVLYIAHPARPSVYIPGAEFHRLVFEHKFSEIVSLLMHLGCKKFRVEHVSGWGREFLVSISGCLPGGSVNGNGSSQGAGAARILYEATFEGFTEPSLPQHMDWYPHEPTWGQVAQGRLGFGLKDFSLKLEYREDYGVSAGFKAKVDKAGFDLGGGYQSFESTVWTISGTF